MVLWAKEIILSRAFPAPAKRRSAQNCGGAATRPFMVTGNWCIEAIRKRVYRRLRKRVHRRLPGCPSTRFGMWRKYKPSSPTRRRRPPFFCGSSRNFAKFIDLFDGVFVLEVDLDT